MKEKILKNLRKTTARQFRNMGIVFILIAIALVVVGKVTGDYFWYIRAGIFCVGAVVVFFLGRRKKNF